MAAGECLSKLLENTRSHGCTLRSMETPQKLTKKDRVASKMEVTFFGQIIVFYDTLFVFSTDDPKQDAASLLTPVPNLVSYALSSGTIGSALHGISVNHLLIGGNSSTANQILSCKWLLKLPWRAKPRVPLERA